MQNREKIKEIYDRQVDRVYRTAMVFMMGSLTKSGDRTIVLCRRGSLYFSSCSLYSLRIFRSL